MVLSVLLITSLDNAYIPEILNITKNIIASKNNLFLLAQI